MEVVGGLLGGFCSLGDVGILPVGADCDTWVRTTGCFLSLDVPTSLAEQGVAGSRIFLRMLLASQLSTYFFFSGGDRGDGFPRKSPELTWYLLPTGASLAFGLF